jgi:heterodisulfide reductase subunit D
MALEDYRPDAMRCNRCSYCKWIPLDRVKSWEFAKGCHSVDYRHFHAYSAGGRLIALLSLTDGRSEISDELVDVVYECTLCGQCDVSCKVCRYDMHILSAAREFRHYLNERGYVPEAYPGVIAKLRETGNMAGAPQVDRAKWAEGLGFKTLRAAGATGADGVDGAEVLFHAGCLYSFNPGLRSAVKAAARVLAKGGLDFAIDGEEGCCGGKAYDMGYRDDFASAAEANMKKWAEAGVRTVITPCATCFWTFKRLYPKVAEGGYDIEVLHTVQAADKLIKEGRLQLTKPVPITVTYHDPCHLGRQGEDYVPWDGKEVKIYGQAVVYDPPRPRYNGAFGVYEPPRDVLKAIPGLELVEMERTKEAAWCCGGGGAVPQAYPDFSAFTAGKRLDEAKSTGAEAIATACSSCNRILGSATASDGSTMKAIDVLELVERAL